MFTDVKTTLRQLRKSPGFTLAAVLTLALGIGATTAIFTLVHAVLLKSLPVKDPGQLWRIGDNEQCCVNGGLPTYQDPRNDWSLFSYEQYREFRDHTPGFESLAAFEATDHQMAVRRAGSSQPVTPLYGEFVSGNSFETLGLRAWAGRLFRPSDDSQGAAPVAVISYQTWQQQFGGDAAILGSSFLVNGQPVTIIGIAPPGFYGERLSPTPPSFWFPLSLLPLLNPESGLLNEPGQEWLNLIGRVAPGTNIAAIQSRLQVELLQFLRSPISNLPPPDRPLIPRQYLRLAPGGSGVQRMQDDYKGDLHLLMWISSFVLLIACANLANLMLARSVTRRQQIAVRTALGATRANLVRRALLECVLLAMIGGLAGVLVAWGGAKLILHLAFQSSPVTVSASPSPVVLAFAFAVSALTGILFGVAPAWLAAHADPIEALRGANRSTGRHATFAQKSLVVAQAAVSVVLLCAAGLLILSLNNLRHQDFGFQTAHRTIVNINPQTAGYKPDQLQAFYHQLHDTLAAIPGVSQVAFSLYSPLDGGSWNENVYVEGEPAPPPGSGINLTGIDRVSPGYFSAIGSKILEGRGFLQSDNASSRNVAVVNEEFVKQYLHGRDAIGVHFGDWEPGVTSTYEIVGVVQNAQYWGADAPIRPMYFVASDQTAVLPPGANNAANLAPQYAHYLGGSHYLTDIVIETRGYFPDLEPQVRTALSSVNPNLMITGFQSFAQQVNLAFSQQNMIVQLTSLFGLVALVLAAIGLYGVTAYTVAQRTSEIGIRMALGANRLNVQQMVLRGAFLQASIGLLIGIPAAIFAGNFMSSQLYGTSAWNPLVLAATTLVLAAAAFIAAVLPARRAASVEPMEALRE